jgi:serine/threonine-protein kinase
MGAIYEVLHNETQRRCVLKTMLGSLLTDADMRARFRLEATVTANVESDHIVDVYDAGIDESTGLPFLVMEYLRGETLANRLRTWGSLRPRPAITLLLQASLALDRTHAAGIVHRDLKPENLFITERDDGSPHVKLLDFGIAKIVSQSANVNTTRSFGTPLYMSPEQIRGDGDIDGRADLYALAQIAFTMLVGHAYFEPEASAESSVYPLLIKVMQGTTVPASERARGHGVSLPAAFDPWFAKATHADAVERFDTAAEQIAELSKILVASPAIEGESLAKATEFQSGAALRGDPATLTGISTTGRNVLNEPNRFPRCRSRFLAALGLAVIGLLGLYLLWIRVQPSTTRPAMVVMSQSVSARAVSAPAPLGTQSTEGASAVPEIVGAQTVPDRSLSASAKMTAAGATRSLPPRNQRKPAVSASASRATVPPSGSANQPRPGNASSRTAYDPSDIR